MNIQPVMKNKCKTCPFREGSPYAYLAPDLQRSAMRSGSRICHSTGSNAIHVRTDKPERLCRGARDYQLRFFHGIGFLREPTDKAWEDKCRELGLR